MNINIIFHIFSQICFSRSEKESNWSFLDIKISFFLYFVIRICKFTRPFWNLSKIYINRPGVRRLTADAVRHDVYTPTAVAYTIGGPTAVAVSHGGWA
jgi:hypothetical protein